MHLLTLVISIQSGLAVLLIILFMMREKGLFYPLNQKRIKGMLKEVKNSFPNKSNPSNNKKYNQIHNFNMKIIALGMDLKMFWISCITVAIFTSFILMSLGYIGIINTIGALVALLLPVIFANRLYASRISEFSEQLEQAISSIVNSIQAGFNLVQAIEIVSKESKEPLASEFKRILEEYHVGVSLQASMAKTKSMKEVEDYTYFKQAIDIYYLSGGDLVEVLKNIVAVMRKRRLLRGDLKAKTSEVRLTANLLIIMPLLLMFYFLCTQPDVIEPLFSERIGRLALGFGFSLWGIGVVLVKKLSNISNFR